VLFVTPLLIHAQIDTDNPLWPALWGLVNKLASPVDTAGAGVISFITGMLFSIFGLLLRLSGFLLNAAVELSILKMSNFINLDGVREAWGIIRDIVNIGFIFGIVYIAISTILRLSGKGIKDLLAKLIIAALLVNFSFFFTGVLIDASNITTIAMYKRIVAIEDSVRIGADVTRNPSGAVIITDPANFDEISNFGISGIFMRYTEITTIFKAAEQSTFGTATALAIALFGSMFLSVLIFSFLLVALLLFIRLIVLIILIVTSPFAYLLYFPRSASALQRSRGPQPALPLWQT